ncbi:hypothetical protein ACXYN8_08660 [Altererythrobacter sp. CAU 1778]
MRVFVLSVGRVGSKTFIEACRHIENFTTGHESKEGALGMERVRQPDNHIEADTRLCWMLGALSREIADGDLVIHLTRDDEKIARSYNRRWPHRKSIIRGYAENILQIGKFRDEMNIARDMVAVAQANIVDFLEGRESITIDIETPAAGFEQMWARIGASGDREAALATFAEVANASRRTNPLSSARFTASLFADAVEKRVLGRNT